jgi:hypothetical protein
MCLCGFGENYARLTNSRQPYQGQKCTLGWPDWQLWVDAVEKVGRKTRWALAVGLNWKV